MSRVTFMADTLHGDLHLVKGEHMNSFTKHKVLIINFFLLPFINYYLYSIKSTEIERLFAIKYRDEN